MTNNNYLDGIRKQFEYYKMLGDRTFAQLTDEQLFGNTTVTAIALP